MRAALLRMGACALGLVVLPGVARAEGTGAAGNPKAQACEDDYQRDNYDAAQADCRDSISSAPTLIGPYERLAAIDIARHHFQEAIAVTQAGAAFATAAEDKVQLERYRGIALFNVGKQDQAIPLLEDVVRVHPEAFDVQLVIGQRSLQVGDPVRARIALEKYLQYRPDKLASTDHAVRYLLAAAYVMAENWQDAQSTIAVGLREKPDDLGFALLQADVYKGEHAWARAAATLEPLLQTTTGKIHALVAYKLAACYAELNRQPEALAMARQYIDAFPGDPRGYLLLGEVHAAASDYRDALAAYESALTYGSAHDPGILLKIGETDLALGNPKDAVTRFQDALAAHSQQDRILADLGRAYIALGSWDRAIATLQRLIAAKPDRLSMANDLLGRAYVGAGRLDQSQAAYQLAYDKSHGGDTFAAKGLVYVLNARAVAAAHQGDPDTAASLLQQALALDPDRLETNRNVAVVALMRGQTDRAQAALHTVLSKVPTDLVANRLLGRLLVAKSDLGGAANAYDVALTQSLRAGSPIAIAEVETEQAAVFVQRQGPGDLDRAVADLDDAIGRPGLSTATEQVIRRARALAYGRRGLLALKAGKGDEAARDLAVATSDSSLLRQTEPLELGFALGLADLETGHGRAAADAFKATTLAPSGGAAGSVEPSEVAFLAPPFDQLGLGFFLAYAQYRSPDPRAHVAAGDAFARLLARSTGGAANMLRALTRSAYEMQAWDAYVAGGTSRAAALFHGATRYLARGENDRVLALDLAALDLAVGRPGARAELEALGGNPPEALVDLGIYWDRQHDPQKAYALFKQGAAEGARADRLGGWITALDREFNFDGGAR